MRTLRFRIDGRLSLAAFLLRSAFR